MIFCSLIFKYFYIIKDIIICSKIKSMNTILNFDLIVSTILICTWKQMQFYTGGNYA